MSSSNSTTRILDAALMLVTKRGGADVTMAEVAKAAAISRQGVYLHFAHRAAFMLALVRHVHEKFGVAEEQRKVTEAPTGIAAMHEWVSLQVRLNPVTCSVVRAFEVVRRTDEAAEQGWQDRQAHRLEVCRGIVSRMREEETLKPGISQDEAADLLWSITSLRTWEDLVLQRGWTATQYEERVTRFLCHGLTNDATGGDSAKP